MGQKSVIDWPVIGVTEAEDPQDFGDWEAGTVPDMAEPELQNVAVGAVVRIDLIVAQFGTHSD